MRAIVVAAVVCVVLAGGCSSKNQVGSNKILNFKEKTSTDLNAKSPAPKAAPAPAAAAKQPVRTAAPRPTAAAAAPTFVVTINSDAVAPNQFQPNHAQVRVGTVVKWTNRDTKPRSVVADGGAFRSPSIAPGSSWSYTASRVGSFAYHDGTRPYAVGSLQVVA
jgi:plastocyanin